MSDNISLAKVFEDLTKIEEKILNQQIIPQDMAEAIRVAKKITLAFELMNISATMH